MKENRIKRFNENSELNISDVSGSDNQDKILYMKQKTLITAESKPLNIADVIGSGNYSIATIRRKSDNKLFGCYFRNGSVKIIKEGDMLGHKHWFIEKETGDEELYLYGVDQKVYDIIEVVED